MSDDISKQLRELERRIAPLQDEDISHDELGEANGFHQAQEAKQGLFRYLSSVISRIETHQRTVCAPVVEEALKHVDGYIKAIEAKFGAIGSAFKKGIHNDDFPRLRENIIEGIAGLEKIARQDLHTLDLDLQLAELRSLIGGGERLKAAYADAKVVLGDIRGSAAEAKRLLDTLRDKSMQKGLAESAGEFDVLRHSHADREFWWFWAFVAAAAVSLLAFAYVAFWDYDIRPSTEAVATTSPNGNAADITGGTAAAVSILLRRILIISAPLVFLKITLTKYNVERNLRIVYDHRQTVLQQYESFENAIGDDAPAKNALRLEVARFIFSDPQTGYLGRDGTSKEISVNPIINMAETMAKSIGQQSS